MVYAAGDKLRCKCGAELTYPGRGRPPAECEDCKRERYNRRARDYYARNREHIRGYQNERRRSDG